MTWNEIAGTDWTLPAARNKVKVDLIRPLSPMYEAIKAGELVARKRGARTVVLSDDLATWLNSLPTVSAARHSDAA